MAETSNSYSVLDEIGDFPSLRPKKRTKHDNFDMDMANSQHPIYVLMKSTDENKVLSRLSVFGVQKGLECITSQISSVTAQRNGELLILAKTKAAALLLCKAKTLGGLCRIECAEHPFLNSSKAKIYCPALMDLDEEDIKTGLASQGVTEVRKIKTFKSNVLVTTPLLILTFNSPEIPKIIKVGYLQVEAKLYIPNPLRCTLCQRFGHGKMKCVEFNGTPACGKCAENITLDDPHTNCEKPVKCKNCSKEHPSYSRDCSIFHQEAEIVKIKTVDRLPFKAAKEKYFAMIRKQTSAAEKFKKSLEEAAINKNNSSTKNNTKEMAGTNSRSMEMQSTWCVGR